MSPSMLNFAVSNTNSFHTYVLSCFILSDPRFIPESPRWLLSQNQNSKAVKITKDMAKENKMILSKKIEVDAENLPNIKSQRNTFHSCNFLFAFAEFVRQ